MSFKKMDLSNRKRPGGRNVVMLYGFAGLNIEKLAGTVLTSGIDEWLYIDETRSHGEIAEILTHFTDNQQVEYKSQVDKVIVFNGVSQYELQQFLDKALSYLEEKPLIAMVTPISKNWTFKALISELKEERKSLKK